MDHRVRRLLVGAFAAMVVGSAREAGAVPSFSRQTGSACSACHTALPELTAYGRAFKATGYTLTAIDEVKAGGADPLSIDKIPPLAVMLTGSWAELRKSDPGTVTDDVLLPDELSLFYSGRIAPHLGAFLQVTYDPQEDHFSMDMLDLRATGQWKDLIYGVTANNNPTVEDLWNSTPAWGWPFLTSGAWPGTGSNGALVDGGLAQAVVGGGPFAMWKNTVYAAAAVYRSAPLGASRPLDGSNANVIHAVAPYWRAALQHVFGPHAFEIGTYGLFAELYPGQAASLPLSGATDQYLDLGVDAQYQFQGGPIVADVHATYLWERRDLAASAPSDQPHLSTVRADADVFWGVVGASAGGFATWGDDSPSWGTTSGAPDTTAMLFELTYRPWQNLYLRAQYTLYLTYDGRKNDYDGSGRNASDNDTMSVLLWALY